jgi:hypothetical protein
LLRESFQDLLNFFGNVLHRCKLQRA